MSNALVLVPENIQVPAHLAQYAAQLASINEAALTGMAPPQPPTIGLKGTRFVVKENGEETIINQLQLQCVIMKVKDCPDKTWYATKFDPNAAEFNAPDCFSLDGIKPDASCTMPQAASCAGCPQNVFGTGTAADGTPGKGKACADNRTMAVFANGGTYKFRIPPASLKNFATYVKQLSQRGLYLPAVITTIGFDPAQSYPVLVFSFGGVLDASQFAAIMSKMDDQAVKDIIDNKPVAQLTAPQAPVTPAPVQQAQAVATAPAASATPKQTKRAATPPAPPTPPVAPVQTVAPAAPQATPDLGLGIAPAPVAPVVQEAAPVAQQVVMGVVIPAPAAEAPVHSQATIADSLGLSL